MDQIRSRTSLYGPWSINFYKSSTRQEVQILDIRYVINPRNPQEQVLVTLELNLYSEIELEEFTKIVTRIRID